MFGPPAFKKTPGCAFCTCRYLVRVQFQLVHHGFFSNIYCVFVGQVTYFFDCDLNSSKFKRVAPELAMNFCAFLSVHSWWAEVFFMVGVVAGEIK